MNALLQDLRYAARTFLRSPGFTIVVVLTLALGIGANAAIFSVFNAVVLRPLAFDDPGGLVMVWESSERWKTERGSVSYPNFADWREQNSVFEGMGTFHRDLCVLTGMDEPEGVECGRVSAGFFPTLHIQAALGRLFRPQDDMAGADNVLVLSDGFWRSHFGASPEIIGQALTINGEACTVIGILPAGFKFPLGVSATQVWAPRDDSHSSQRSSHYLKVVARLKPGVTLEQAQVQMDTIARRLEKEHPNTNTGRGASVTALQEEVVGNVRPVLLVLLGAAGLVLLIACANVTNLLLAKNASRGRELGVRAALGAARLRLIRQLLTESTTLGLLGGGMGVLLALWSVDALVAVIPSDFPRLDNVGLDGRVLGFSLVITLLTSVTCGLVPGLQVTGLHLQTALKESGRTFASIGRHRMRKTLVVSQLALALALLVGAGLLLRSFQRLIHVDPGFAPDRMLTFQMAVPKLEDFDPRQRAELYGQVLARLESLPGAQAVAASATLPWTGSSIGRSFTIPAGAELTGDEELYASFGSVNADYFRAMGIPLLKGRCFTEQDGQGDQRVAIINETMARRFWADDDPVGELIAIPSGRPDGEVESYDIVGIVGDVRASRIDLPAEPRMYVPYQQSTWPFMCFALRTSGDPLDLAGAVRSEVAAITKDEPVYKVKTLDQHLAKALQPRRFPMVLFGIFGALALILAAVGVYGVVSHAVAQRTHEIGVRMALGAQRRDVLRFVLKQGIALTLLGLGIGVIVAAVGSRALSSLLYEIGATDPWTFGGGSLLLAAVALLACYLPAHRATKVDPMVALRCE